MKILVLNSKLDPSPYYKKHGVTLDITYDTLEGIFPLTKVSTKLNEQNQMTDFYTPEVMDAIREKIKPFQYHVVIFGYRPQDYDTKSNTSGGYTYGQDVYLGTQLCTVRLDGNETLYATHELMHTLCNKVNRLGFHALDEMDMTLVNGSYIPYYKNEQPDAPDGNYAATWGNILPYEEYFETMPPLIRYSTKKNPWAFNLQLQLISLGYSKIGYADGYFGAKTLAVVKQIQEENELVVDGIVGAKTLSVLGKKDNIVRIKRLSDNGIQTLGKLTVGDFSCDTLELPWKENQHNISCIPLGTYQCEVRPYKNTNMYQVLNVPKREGIFFHPGNHYTDILGCILLGVSPTDINNDGQIDVTNSIKTVAAFIEKMQGKPFTLEIT